MATNPACLDSYAITSKTRGCVINWEIHDSFSIRNTWEGSQSSFTCPLWLMHLQHVWPYCTRTQHWIVHNVLGLSKHHDGEISSKYQSSCQVPMLSLWAIGRWGRSVWEPGVLSVTASVGFDPTHRSDLTQLFSIMTCLTAHKHQRKKLNKTTITRQAKQQRIGNFLSWNSHFWELHRRLFKCSRFRTLSW